MNDNPKLWKPWFLMLWGVVGVGMITLFFLGVLPVLTWTALAVGAFFIMETIGMLHSDDGYPPLTNAIGRFCPRWVTYTLLYFLIGWVMFGDVRRAGLMGGLGWLTSHFDLTYDGER